MGRASDPRRQFHRALDTGRLDDAIRFAHFLPVSIDEAARLVALAGRERAASFERMAVRFLTVLLEERELTLGEVLWIVHRLQDAHEGRYREAEQALRRFVAA